MTTFKGTPGLWTINYWTTEHHRFTYRINVPSDQETQEEADANAAAIQAVPDMIEALQEFIEWAEKQGMWDKCGQSYYKTKAALSKALD